MTTKQELIQRTKLFALRVIKVVQALPRRDDVAMVLGRQLLRAGTSAGANYRAACRAKSAADFLDKLKIVEEECDETPLLAGAAGRGRLHVRNPFGAAHARSGRASFYYRRRPANHSGASGQS